MSISRIRSEVFIRRSRSAWGFLIMVTSTRVGTLRIPHFVLADAFNCPARERWTDFRLIYDIFDIIANRYPINGPTAPRWGQNYSLMTWMCCSGHVGNHVTRSISGIETSRAPLRPCAKRLFFICCTSYTAFQACARLRFQVGCAMNSVENGKIRRERATSNTFVFNRLQATRHSQCGTNSAGRVRS
jgi:hypothetical protein